VLKRKGAGFMTQSKAFGRAFLFGAVTGLRSMIGTALISRHLADQTQAAGQNSALSLLAKPGVANVLTALSAGEVVADKLPGIPARTSAGSLIARAVLGAIVGAAACSEERENAAAGAIIGAGAAVAATFGAYYLRRWLTRDLGLPDPIVAGAEDAIAYTVGRRAAKR
jgi:uncharacterized membrane protein